MKTKINENRIKLNEVDITLFIFTFTFLTIVFLSVIKPTTVPTTKDIRELSNKL
jgi:hypothetical protein